MRQNDLFSMLPKRTTQNKNEVQTNLVSALNKVNTAPKYTPSVAIQSTALLRQQILLVESLVKQGKFKPHPNDRMLRTKDELWKEIKKIKELGIFSWDTEFDNLKYEDANLVGLSFFNYNEDSSFYVPFIHCDSNRNIHENQLTYKEFTEVAGEVFESPKIKKITHQYNSCDNQVLAYNTGIFVGGQYWDTLLFMNAIDENRLSGNSLKKLYSEFVLQEEGSQDTYEELFGKNLSFAFVPLDLAYVYGCKDSRMTYEVYEAQKKILSAPEYKKMLQHYIEVEAPQLEVVNKMQYRGVLLSDETISSLHDEYTELINSLKSELDNYFFVNFGLKGINYNSPDQLKTIIYDKMGCQSVDRKKPRGTGEDIIEKLVQKYPHYSILKKLLTYRSVGKLLNTYINALPPQRSKKDNALRGRFFSHGARTGRYSSAEPNLQNIPSGFNKDTGKDDSRIRNMFVPRPGYVWISSDYSGLTSLAVVKPA